MTLDISLHKLKSKKLQKHSGYLPNEHVRAIFTGPSGNGKTQRLISCLLQPNFLDYNHLILYTPTIDQFGYHLLSEGFNNDLSKQEIIEIINNFEEYIDENDDDYSNEAVDNIVQAIKEVKEERRSRGNILKSENITVDCYTPENANDLPRAEEQNPSIKHVIVFDDCMNREEMKPVILDYFTNGRHANVSPFYLNQKYTNRDTTIRENANLILLFNPSIKPLQSVYDDCCQYDVDWDPFYTACKRVFTIPYNFVVIDKTAQDLNRKLREGFTKPLLLEENESMLRRKPSRKFALNKPFK